MIFKGSIEGSFFNSQIGFSSTAFTTVIDATTKWRLWFDIMTNEDITSLKKSLKPKVKERLNNAAVKPEEIFNTFGTHYLADVYIGASARYNAITILTEKINKTNISTAIEFDYKRVSGNAKVDINSESKEIINNTQTEFTVVGGNAEFMKDLNNTDLYIKWAEGIKNDGVLCNFSDKSLRPIWELCDNKVRAKQLEDYFFKVYLPKYPLPSLQQAKINPFVFINKMMNGDKNKGQFQGNFTGKGKKEYIYFSHNGIELIFGDNYENSKSIARYGTNLGNWSFTINDQIIDIGDFNDDGKTDLLVKSSWGIGLLTLSEEIYLKDYFGVPFGNNLGSWQINVNDAFVIGKFKGGKKDYIAVKSGWGLGQLEFQAGKGLISSWMKPNGTSLNGWQINAGDIISKSGDVDGNGKDELFIQSDWGICLLLDDGNGFNNKLWFSQNGNSIGGWQLNKGDRICAYGDFDGDKKDEVVVKSNWGVGLLEFEHGGLASFWLKPFKTNLGSWNVNVNDKIQSSYDVNNDNKVDFTIMSSWGRAILQWTGDNVQQYWMQQQ